MEMEKFTKEQVEEEFGKYTRNVTEDDVSDILDKENDILNKAHGPLEKFGSNIKLLFSVLKDYVNGNYKEIPWTTIAAVIGSLIYVFSPIDLIPDIIPIVGLTDDAAVLGFCLAGIAGDLDKYRKWKKRENVEYQIEDDPVEQKMLPDNVDNNILMVIEDVFAIAGRGTAVVGQIKSGRIGLYEEVEVVGFTFKKRTMVVAIEMYNKILDEAVAGDNVGLFLWNIAKDQIKKGDYLTKNF
jgi:uncharacterized membrane protein YkvA (DUF1232 family)